MIIVFNLYSNVLNIKVLKPPAFQVRFMNRKFSIAKKAYELSKLCESEVAIIIFDKYNKLYEYCSNDIDQILLKYNYYSGSYESLSNYDIVQVKLKKTTQIRLFIWKFNFVNFRSWTSKKTTNEKNYRQGKEEISTNIQMFALLLKTNKMINVSIM